MREREPWWSPYGVPGRVGAAVAGLFVVVLTLVKGAYGGTVVAVAIVVIALASARRYSNRHPRA